MQAKFSLDLQKLKEDLKEDEGCETRPYFDKYGYVSFGIGRNLHANPLTSEERELGRQMGFSSMAFVEYLFFHDIQSRIKEVKDNFAWTMTAPEAVNRMLVNMVYQMGLTGVKGFRESLYLLREERYKQAATQLKESKWARIDTPQRANRVINRMLAGVGLGSALK